VKSRRALLLWLNTLVPFTTFSGGSILSLSSSWGGLFEESALDSMSLVRFSFLRPRRSPRTDATIVSPLTTKV
jgi:hypothetical protein